MRGACMVGPCHVTKRSLITSVWLCVLQVARSGNSMLVP